ncbi:hypothetical protein DRO59_04285 [Candidatus Bathyarchaeota archaeon]|nr:MAG: hypothetical protein DRO59_04285 [Candidatus Bathyarchaeota archaeon]
MSLEELVSKYMRSAERALSELKVVVNSLTISVNDVRRVVDSAKAYLYDAEYYRDRKRFEVSLASVAYCEGLLDALKMLGAVEFEWVREKRNEK